MMKAVQELQEQASILGVNPFNSKAAVLLCCTDAFPGYKAAGSRSLVRSGP
jgi:hypothetical protein